jgi:hydroxyacylglutathione hydrolase
MKRADASGLVKEHCPMLLRRFYHEGLAQASYLVGCQASGEAAVIDPNRAIDQYLAAAEQEGLRITAVTETHIHADFVSGARELAQRTGATLYLSDEGPADWKYAFAAAAGATLVHDGDTITVGNVRLRVLHTPGHTPEHIAFLLFDRAQEHPMGIFSGDVVFVGDVGRPDLLERAAGFGGTMEAGARQLFRSLQRFRELPDYVQVWPGHGAGSACGKALGAVPQSTVGYEQQTGWAFQIADEDAFVEAVLAGQPDPPRYFAQMKRVNKLGPAPRPDDLPRHLDAGALTQAVDAGWSLIDARVADTVAHGLIPGALNIPVNRDFLTRAGSHLPYDRPLALIADEALARRLREELLLIGLDAVAGFITPEVAAGWSAQPLAQIDRRNADELRPIVERNGMLLLDVRTPAEYAAGHLRGSVNIPLNQLPVRLGEIPRDRPLLVYCQGGNRSAVATSILAGQGFARILEMRDGFAGWVTAGHPVERAR